MFKYVIITNNSFEIYEIYIKRVEDFNQLDFTTKTNLFVRDSKK